MHGKSKRQHRQRTGQAAPDRPGASQLDVPAAQKPAAPKSTLDSNDKTKNGQAKNSACRSQGDADPAVDRECENGARNGDGRIIGIGQDPVLPGGNGSRKKQYEHRCKAEQKRRRHQ